MRNFKGFLIFLIIFFIGFSLGHSYIARGGTDAGLAVEKNTPQAFISEVYEKIKDNYWDNISDTQLLELFKLSFDKSGGSTYKSKFTAKDELIQAVAASTKGMDEATGYKFTQSLASGVLSSLSPAGRSGLYTTKQEEQLKNTVENVDPQKDLYKNLGVNKGASESAVEQAFQKQSEQLSRDKSNEAQQKLKEITYAREVLTQQDTKKRYDQKGVEPTIFAKAVSAGVLYLQFKKFSPTSYDEFIKAFEAYKDNAVITSLILDLRGNSGGAIDAAPYFLGNFIGKNQTAFDFFHKGDYLPFKTPTDKQPSVLKYKQVVILVDNSTQSSAELMAASFKKYHTGVVLGAPTRGWGTVEKVFPIDNQFEKNQKYSLFLVHSITLRDDNLPIEGRGVEPDINFNSEDWEQKLFSYFMNQQLIEAVKSVK